MTKADILARMEEIGIIPSVRMSSAEDALFAAEAVAAGGIPIVEVPMTIPGGVELIGDLVRRNPHMIVGAGTLLDVGLAQRCVDAGAVFLTSPHLDLEIVKFGRAANLAVLPGALTPSEVALAYHSGADIVKVFPCGQVGGPSYIRALKPPFPEVRLMAAGGVNQQNVGDYFRAGALAIGIGSNLIHAEAIHRREAGWIKQLAGRYLHLIGEARSH